MIHTGRPSEDQSWQTPILPFGRTFHESLWAVHQWQALKTNLVPSQSRDSSIEQMFSWIFWMYLANGATLLGWVLIVTCVIPHSAILNYYDPLLTLPGSFSSQNTGELSGVLPSMHDNLLSLVSLPIMCSFIIWQCFVLCFNHSMVNTLPIKPLLSLMIFSVGRLYFICHHFLKSFHQTLFNQFLLSQASSWLWTYCLGSSKQLLLTDAYLAANSLR